MNMPELTPMQEAVYGVIQSITRKCAPWPGGPAVADMAGVQRSSINSILFALQMKELIKVETIGKRSIVTDLRTGFETARPEHGFVQPDDISLKKRVFANTPCPYCGVRPDVACKHQRLA